MSNDMFNPGDVIRHRKDPQSLGITVNTEPADTAVVLWLEPPKVPGLQEEPQFMYYGASEIERTTTVKDLVALSERLANAQTVVVVDKKQQQQMQAQEQQQRVQQEQQFRFQYRPLTREEEFPGYGF
jgi:hypothetical protein